MIIYNKIKNIHLKNTKYFTLLGKTPSTDNTL